jgi:hypothetical protein
MPTRLFISRDIATTPFYHAGLAGVHLLVLHKDLEMKHHRIHLEKNGKHMRRQGKKNDKKRKKMGGGF